MVPREDYDICEITLTRRRNPSLDHRDNLFRQDGGQRIPEQIERAVEKGRVLDVDRMGRHGISDVDIKAENHLRSPDAGGNAEPNPGIERSIANNLRRHGVRLIGDAVVNSDRQHGANDIGDCRHIVVDGRSTSPVGRRLPMTASSIPPLRTNRSRYSDLDSRKRNRSST